MTSHLMEYFNRQPRIGTISTAGKDGKVDVAVFGSPHMSDEKTVVLVSGENRTLANLRENPHAVYMIMEPGAGLMDWKGVRVYMTLKDLAASGPALDGYVAQLATVVGEAAASMIRALATFEVTEIRPIVDMGQGWEQSI
ncbi:MAG: pyridoxamine 5'-phosphate oxidase family protein [Methanospirillum sp.]